QVIFKKVTQKHLVSAIDDTETISQNWDELLRVAGSLKSGTVGASELMRCLANCFSQLMTYGGLKFNSPDF
ncbi:MAG: Tn3 family transposase, partial [Candidatus Obscuribacterales bacterium]|nr:Tn3 family transposase [Candidatus Obscuribacterales bacterium]